MDLLAGRFQKWHGTGRYYNETTQVGMSLLLTKAVEDAWSEYVAKLKAGELSPEE
jgi:hypothetical protein